MNWGLDLTEGVKGKNYNNETKKIMESGRIEVFGAGAIKHPKAPQPSSSFSFQFPSTPSQPTSSSVCSTSTASSSSSSIISTSSSRMSTLDTPLNLNTPSPRPIFMDDNIVFTPVAALVVPQTPPTGGWVEIPDSAEGKNMEIVQLIPHRGFVGEPSSPKTPSSASKIAFKHCSTALHQVSTPHIHQYSILGSNRSSEEVERDAWLKEKKKSWKVRRCFKSDLDTVDELKRIPQVDGDRRKTLKRGRNNADLPIQNLTDLVDIGSREIEPLRKPLEGVLNEVRPLSPSQGPEKENKKRQLDFSSPKLDATAKFSSLIPHSRAAKLSTTILGGSKRRRLADSAILYSVAVPRQTSHGSLFRPFLLPPTNLNNSSKPNNSNLLVRIPHRKPDRCNKPPMVERDLASLVADLFTNFTDEVAEQASNQSNGYPVGAFFFKEPKNTGNKDTQRDQARAIAKRFCSFSSASAKKIKKRETTILGFVSIRERRGFSYAGALSGSKVLLDVVSSRVDMCNSISFSTSTDSDSLSQTKNLSRHALETAAGCFGKSTEIQLTEGCDFTGGSEVEITATPNHKKPLRNNTKDVLRTVARTKTVVQATIEWLKEKKKAKKEGKKMKARAKAKTKELLAAVKLAKKRLLEESKSDSDDSKIEDKEEEEDAKEDRGGSARDGRVEEERPRIPETAPSPCPKPTNSNTRNDFFSLHSSDPLAAANARKDKPETSSMCTVSQPKPKPPTPITSPLRPQPAPPTPQQQPATTTLHGLCSTDFGSQNTILVDNLAKQHGIELHPHPSIDFVSCEVCPNSAIILHNVGDQDVKAVVCDLSNLRTLKRYKKIFIILNVRPGNAGIAIFHEQRNLTDLHNCAGDDRNGDMINIMYANNDSVGRVIKEIVQMCRNGEEERNWLSTFKDGGGVVDERIEEVIHTHKHFSVFKAQVNFGGEGP